MRIGELVKQHITPIFSHCENVDHDEIERLLNPSYSKRTFGINFPFCSELENLERSQSIRYWKEIYSVRKKRVRVTSQWFERQKLQFIQYLESKQIAKIDFRDTETNGNQANKKNQAQPRSSRSNSRYGACHIGEAQNQFIRNILSSLGTEFFSRKDWDSAKEYFSRTCAYCDAEADLEMDHAIPINKESLGEHRLGNLVPSCHPCNSEKNDKHFREFLKEKPSAITRIEEYMALKKYSPLENNEQLKMILDLAHKEIATLADRYIAIINKLL